jgi:hypothetical protein
VSIDSDFVEKTKQRILERWGERISHPRIRGKLSFDDCLSALILKIVMCDEMDFETNVHRLYYVVPESWEDEQFLEDLENAVEDFEETIPTFWCGQVWKSQVEVKQEYDWRLVFQAIMNLFERRNLLLEKDRVEVASEGEVETEGSNEA